MPFDPTQPFELVAQKGEDLDIQERDQPDKKTGFDPSQPFELVETTPSGAMAKTEQGLPSQQAYEEVIQKEPLLDKLIQGGSAILGQAKRTLIPRLGRGDEVANQGILQGAMEAVAGSPMKGIGTAIQGIKKGTRMNLPENLENAGIETLPEAALAATEDYVSIAKAIKDQAIDKAGRAILKGPEWERKREYDRFIESIKEGERRAEGKSRLGDVFRAIGDDQEAEAIDRNVNQEAANVLSLVADPSFLLSGGSTGALRKLASVPLKTVGGVGKAVIGEEKAAQILSAAQKIAESRVAQKISDVVQSPTATTLKGLGLGAKGGSKILDTVIAPALEKIAENPIKSAIASGIITGVSTGDASKGIGAGLGVGIGLRPNLVENVVGRTGVLNRAFKEGGEVLDLGAEAIKKGGGRQAFIDLSKKAVSPNVASAFKSAAGLAPKGAKSAGTQYLIRGGDLAARYIIDPSIRGSAVGAGLGYITTGTAQGAAEMAGQGLVIGPFGHVFDKAVGSAARPSWVKNEKTGNYDLQIMQNPETLVKMQQSVDEWLNSLPEQSRDAIMANAPDINVLYKMADVHRLAAGQGAKEGTFEQNQFNVYRDSPQYDAIMEAGAGTAGASQGVSAALANAQNILQSTTEEPAKIALNQYIEELQNYGGQSVLNNKTGKYEADPKGSKRAVNLINAGANEFQTGANVFHEIAGHGSLALSGEEGTAYGEALDNAKRKVIESFIGIRDAEGNLVLDKEGKPIKEGSLGKNLEKSILDYANLLPESAKQSFLKRTEGKGAMEIAEEMAAEGASAFAREAPGSVSEYAQSLARPSLIQKVYRMLNIRKALENMGVKFIDSADITGSTIFRDEQGNPMQLNDEQRAAFAELLTLQNEATERLASGEGGGDVTRSITPDEIRVNPALAQEVIASGAIKTRTKTSIELMAEAADIFRQNNGGKEPTNAEIRTTLDESLKNGKIDSEAPQFTGNGEPIINKPADIKKADEARTTAIQIALDSLGQDKDPRALRKINPKDEKPYYTGQYLSEEQLKAIESLSDKVVNRRMKAYLRLISEHLRDQSKRGLPLQWLYYAATKGGKYSSGISQSFRVASPTSMHISKANNFTVNMFDHSRFAAALREAIEAKPDFLKPWGDVSTPETRQSTINLFLNNVEQYLDNHEKGLPGREFLHANPAEAQKRAAVINDFFNIKDSDTAFKKAGEFPENQFYRKLRIDRIGDISEGNLSIEGRKMRLPINLEAQKQAFMPAVGELAAGIGDTKEARAMEANGSNAEEIFKKTGWWKGADDKWRFEVDDSKAKWIGGQVKLDRGERVEPTFLLSSVYSNPALEKAYPQMFAKENGAGVVKVTFDRNLAPGEAMLQHDMISIGIPHDGSSLNKRDVESMISHELQHHIQRSEGFHIAPEMGLRPTPKEMDAYWKSPAEIEARLTQRRIAMTPEERMATPPWVTQEQMLAEEAATRTSNQRRYMPAVSPLGFYSQVEANVEKLPEKFTFAQLKAALSPEKGVKPDELTWMDWDTFAKDKTPDTKLTRQDVQNWVNENKVDVQEVVKGNKQFVLPMGWNVEQMDAETAEIFGGKEGDWLLLDQNGNDVVSLGSHPNAEMAKNAAKDSAAESGIPLETFGGESGDLKFSQYQEPGGENYRELLLTLPTDQKLPKATIIERPDGTFRVKLGNQSAWANSKVMADSIAEMMEKDPKNKVNEGSAVFRSTHFSEPNILAHVRFNERTGANGEKILFIEEFQTDWINEAQQLRREEIKRLVAGGMSEADAIKQTPSTWAFDNNKLPKTPFNTQEKAYRLAAKRMLKYAADNGFDKIAWTTGEQQAARYDLSKALNSVEVTKNDNGTYVVSGSPKDNSRQENGLFQDQVPEQKLADVIGKELAEKSIKDLNEGKEAYYQGLDLKVGGEGMKGFYDKILPETMNKLGKKLGFKTGEIEIPVELEADSGSFKAHSIDLTPQAKETVKRGQPLFMPAIDQPYLEALKGDIKEGKEAASIDEKIVRENVEPDLQELFLRYLRADKKSQDLKEENTPSANRANRAAATRLYGQLARAYSRLHPEDEMRVGLADQHSKVLEGIEASGKEATETAVGSQSSLQSSLKSAKPEDRQGIVNDWLKANPKAAAELQRQVDEAAKKSGYLVKAWHGTSGDESGNFPFTVFNTTRKGDLTKDLGDKAGAYFAKDKKYSEGAAFYQTNMGRNGKPVVEEFYLKNPQETRIDEVSGKVSEYRIENPEQAKLASPITFDDSGNIIPLSQRFDVGSEDIRYMPTKHSKKYAVYLGEGIESREFPSNPTGYTTAKNKEQAIRNVLMQKGYSFKDARDEAELRMARFTVRVNAIDDE